VSQLSPARSSPDASPASRRPLPRLLTLLAGFVLGYVVLAVSAAASLLVVRYPGVAWLLGAVPLLAGAVILGRAAQPEFVIHPPHPRAAGDEGERVSQGPIAGDGSES
jgi:hypothetical protein